MNAVARPTVTPRQLQVLTFIAAQTAANGWPPSRREIALECLGARSPNAAQEHVDKLITKQLIEVVSNASRAITITDLGRDLLRKVARGKL